MSCTDIKLIGVACIMHMWSMASYDFRIFATRAKRKTWLYVTSHFTNVTDETTTPLWFYFFCVIQRLSAIHVSAPLARNHLKFHVILKSTWAHSEISCAIITLAITCRNFNRISIPFIVKQIVVHFSDNTKFGTEAMQRGIRRSDRFNCTCKE